jgi:hypothetical protein
MLIFVSILFSFQPSQQPDSERRPSILDMTETAILLGQIYRYLILENQTGTF